MKSTGMVRKIDCLGRIVVPMELRKMLDIKNEDPVEIFTQDNYILLKKYQPACIFCYEANNVINHRGQNICPNCVEAIRKLEL